VWPETLRFLARSGVDLTPLVTHRFGVERAVEALHTAHHPDASTIKAHIEF
jgi:L-iditol 2-dehydrogenase